MIDAIMFLGFIATLVALYTLVVVFVEWAYTKVMLWHLGHSQSEISKHDLYEVKEDAFKYGVGWLIWLCLGVIIIVASPFLLILYGAIKLYEFMQEQINLN